MGDVPPVGIGAEADQLCVDARAACFGVFQLLQDECSPSLADDQAVPVPVKRAGSELGSVVFNRGGEERVKYRRVRRVKLLAAAGDHDQLAPIFDRLIGVADSLAA